MATSQHPSLKLNSPAYVEPMFYKWPLQTGSGGVHDSGIEILDAIRWVCDDMPVIKSSLEHIELSEVDTTCYDSMREVCDIYNKAIDSVAGLVSVHWHTMAFIQSVNQSIKLVCEPFE